VAAAALERLVPYYLSTNPYPGHFGLLSHNQVASLYMLSIMYDVPEDLLASLRRLLNVQDQRGFFEGSKVSELLYEIRSIQYSAKRDNMLDEAVTFFIEHST
jgi:hypothetical protein